MNLPKFLIKHITRQFGSDAIIQQKYDTFTVMKLGKVHRWEEVAAIHRAGRRWIITPTPK